ncbi:MAG: hypothetical protein HKO03_01020 [Acidimicrobiia bacterium]|nr:hypothetical protein [Acidimicrobiia bacterium]
MTTSGQPVTRISIALVAAFCLATAALLLPTPAAQAADVGCGAAEIAGAVFRDYNADGVAGATEPGQPGLTVTAFDTAGAVVSATVTDAVGAWSLTVGDGATVRVEVTGLPNHLQPGPGGPGSLTTVFTTIQGSVASCNLDVGVANPGEYCQANPDLVSSCFIEGPSTGITDAALVRFANTSGYAYQPGDSPLDPAFSGGPGLPPATEPAHDSPAPAYPATIAEVGSTFGVAHERATGDVFVASFLKRHAGFGSTDSPGTIYRIDGASGVVSPFVEVPGTGANPHPNATTNFFFDNNSFDLIGGLGLGDLDISDDDQTLYTVNLLTKSLVAIPIDTPLVQTSYAIPTGACAVAADARPFGLGVHDGIVYIGVTCSGETNQLQSDMSIHVLTFDGATINPVPVLNAPIDPAAYPHPGFTAWNPWFGWANKPASIDPDPGIDTTVVPQAWLTDLDFDGDDMILGIRDRTGDQFGSELGGVDPTETNTTDIYRGQGFGDILRACGSPAAGWTLEAAATCGAVTTSGAGNSGPGGGEYYFEDHYLDAEDIAAGGIAQIPGQTSVATVVWDPIFIPGFYNDGGFIWLDNATGARTQAYRVFDTDGDSSPTFAKSNGLGDLHAVCDAAPIEIGNYVWLDSDADGVQDPDEPPIESVTVELFDSVSGALVATTATDAAGHYYFGEADGVLPETGYELRLSGAALAGLGLTVQDSPSGSDINDSDGGTLAGGSPGLVITTGPSGANDHSFDFGFVATYDLALRLTVDPSHVGPAAPGSDVPFVIEVFNQGGAIASSVEISNYVQPGFTFDPAKNPAWTSGAIPTTTLPGALAASASTSVSIILTVDPGFGGSVLTNHAEISSDDGADIDSIPDAIQGNDPVIDDEINDPGVLDEDDHDIASVSVGAVASIGDRVWFDTNQDGIQDAGETGVAGVTVVLSLPDLTPVASTSTDTNGNYVFENLAPGDYKLSFTIPPGYTISPINAGGDDLADSDVDPATGMTAVTTLDPSEIDISWDLGMYLPTPTGSISGGIAFNDTDGDGTQDLGEQPVPGVTVNLIDAGTGDVVATTTTAADGSYGFGNLAPGTYVIVPVAPAGGTIISPAGGQSAPITVQPGVGSAGVDIAIAGDILPATGFNSDVIFNLAMVLLIIGSAMVIVTGRTRSRLRVAHSAPQNSLA